MLKSGMAWKVNCSIWKSKQLENKQLISKKLEK